MNNLSFTTEQYQIEIRVVLHGIEIVCTSGEARKSLLLHSNAGLLFLNKRCAVILDDSLFLIIGKEVCRLELPALELAWRLKCDTAACLGICLLPGQGGVIVHGECEISRLDLSGEIAWQASGKDIFTEGFELFSTHIEAIDFNGEKYKIDLITGAISLQRDG